jgi:hypothetical protein
MLRLYSDNSRRPYELKQMYVLMALPLYGEGSVGFMLQLSGTISLKFLDVI